jgi:hypothetical protein
VEIPVWTAMERMPFRWAAIISLGASPTSALGVPLAIQPWARAWRMARRDQSGAVLGHFAEGSEAEIRLQAGAFEFLPSDAGEVAGDQSENHAILLQAAQEGAHAGTGFALQVRDAAHIDLLRAADDLGHGAADGGGGCAGVAQHAGEDVGIEHAVHGDVPVLVSRPVTRRTASTSAWR